MQLFAIKVAFAFIFSFLVTFYLVPFFCSLAYKINFCDIPDGNIKKHAHATPYMGGVAVYCGFLSGLAFTMPIENSIFLLLVGTMLLLFVGLLDDFYVLKAYQKFSAQAIIALCFLKAGFYLKEHFFYNIWNMPLSFLWILTVINSFNLVDVMDGLTATVAITATTTLLVIAFYLKHFTVMILLAAFLGALYAFLWYNKPRAQIYLGDAGSLFIGGLLAVVPFLFDWGTYNAYGYIAPVIILAIPLLECLQLVCIRIYKGIPFYLGSPDHFSLYLLSYGWTKDQVLYYVVLLSLYLGLSATLFVFGKISLMSIALLGILFLFIWVYNLTTGNPKSLKN